MTSLKSWVSKNNLLQPRFVFGMTVGAKLNNIIFLGKLVHWRSLRG